MKWPLTFYYVFPDEATYEAIVNPPELEFS